MLVEMQIYLIRNTGNQSVLNVLIQNGLATRKQRKVPNGGYEVPLMPEEVGKLRQKGFEVSKINAQPIIQKVTYAA